MQIKTKIIKQVFKCDAYQILGAIPTNDEDFPIELNSYGNFSIKDPTLLLSEQKEYTLELTETEFRGTKQYIVESILSLTTVSAESITDEMELDILKDITTDSQAENIHEAYPNFIRLILQGKEKEIDTNNIYNVGETRLKVYIREVNEKYKYYYIMDRNRDYNLDIKDCKELCKIFGTVEKVDQAIKNSPYSCLIDLCHYKFTKVDDTVLKTNPDFRYSNERIEFLILSLLDDVEAEGSTYIDANELAEYVNGIDNNIIPLMKDVVMKSDRIYYDEKTKFMAKMSIYIAECTIADFIKDKLKQSSKLEWEWEKFTKIKDGTLTEEQSNVLKTFCEYNFCVLDAPSGTGKTSVLKAVLDMCDAYNYSYCCLAFTGKASSRMSAQTGREATTIHRKTMGESIYEDVLIVDEYSMLSIDLMTMIIGAIKNPYIRVFFVGDSEQIPSIGVGRIANDLLECPNVPTCTLTYCFRFSDGGASYVSTLTRQGKFYLTEEQCGQDKVVLGKNKDYTFIQSDGTTEQIISIYMDLIKKGIKKEDICVLTPYNKYEFGATNINNLIQLEMNPSKPNENIMKSKQNGMDVIFRKGDLIMNIKNDYNALPLESYQVMWDEDVTEEEVATTTVFNGQVGKVLSIDDKVLTAQIEEKILVFNKSKCYNLLLSYSTNPFKFQGSSCKYIINLVLPYHKPLLNRQLLYTAQTRQEKCLIEIGDIDTIKYALRTVGSENRQTFLKHLLNDNFNQ